jgi:hypothetical protein
VDGLGLRERKSCEVLGQTYSNWTELLVLLKKLTLHLLVLGLLLLSKLPIPLPMLLVLDKQLYLDH